MTEFEALLTSAVTLRISPSEAIRGLTAFATVDFDANPAYVNYRKHIGEEVEIRPEHVRAALREFLAGRFSAKELRDWCLFIVLSGHYKAPEPPQQDEDWYDDLWDTVYDFAAPEVHGEITSDAASEKLVALERYGDDREPSAV